MAIRQGAPTDGSPVYRKAEAAIDGHPSAVVMTAIARVAATINAEQDPEMVLQLICREARDLFGVDSTVVWEREKDDLYAAGSAGDAARRLHGFHIPVDDPHSIACRCFRERMLILDNRVLERGTDRPLAPNVSPARSLLCVPLLHRGDVLGVLGLRDCSAPDRFTQADLEAASVFADMAAVAMANSRLRGDLERHAREAAALSKIGRIVTSGVDLLVTSESFARELRNLISFDRFAIALIDGSECYKRFLVAGLATDEFGPGTASPIAGSSLEWVLERGQPLVSSDLQQEQLFPADRFLADAGLRSGVRVPLVERGEMLGTLNLFSSVPNAYGARDVELLEQVTGQIAGVFANAQMVESQRLILSRLYSLQRVTDAALSTLDLDSLLDSLLERSIEIVGADSGIVFMVDESSTELSIRGARWMAGEQPQSYRRRLGEGITGRVALEGEPRLIPDVDLADPADLALTRRRGIRSVLAVPLNARGKCIGVFRLDSREPGHFHQQHLRLMEVAAARMALAIDNARLMQEARERASHEALIHRIASAIGSSLDLNRVMDAAVRELRAAIDASRCAVVLANAGDAHAWARWESRADGIPPVGAQPIPWINDDRVRSVMLSHEPTVIEDVESQPLPESILVMARKLGVKSVLATPLLLGGEMIGGLELYQYGRARRWTEWEVEVVRAVAAQLAVAVQNARLYEETDEKLRARVREIQTQKSRTDALLSSMSEGMYATDLERRITTVNPSLEALVGRRADDMVGRYCRDVLEHTDEDGAPLCDVACPMMLALKGERATDATAMFTRTAWGDRLPTSICSAPIRDESGGVTGVVAVMRDISREWQVDKLKSNIVSVVSHEFRTPLTSIIGFSELLLERDQPEDERRDCLKHIHEEGLRLEGLVGDFLDLSRLDAGRVMLNPEPVEPATVVRNAIEDARMRLGGRRLDSEVEGGLPLVEADPERLAQILENLLSNAIKYSPDGTTIVLRARCASRDEDGRLSSGGDGPGWVVFTVEDRGFGIPPDQLSEIFTPFHRVEGASTRRIRGTGLGLSIVKSLVELHRGKLWVESEAGVGSRFHVALRAVSP